MGPNSKDLLELEQKKSSPSLESTLLVCKSDSLSKTPKPPHSGDKLATTSVPKSQVLGKVKDFLGVLGEANKRLKLDAQENSCKDHDIEVLNGNETEYIEMAVAAAESVMAGSQPACTLAADCSGSSYEHSSDDDVDDDNICSPDKCQKPEDGDGSLNNDRPKIIELG